MSLIKIQGKTKIYTGYPPNAVSGLQLWLDSSDPTTLYNSTVGGSLVTADGSAVARWEDKSGNNRHATQNVISSQPFLKVNAKNGKNTLRFDGFNDFFAVNSVASFYRNSHTIFAVGSLDGLLEGALIAAVGYHQTIRLSSTTATTEIHDPYAGSNISYTSGNWGVFVRRLVSSSATTLQIFKNGNSGSLISRSGPITRTPSVVNIGCASGSPGGPFSYFLKGDISEILIYNSALTAIERQGIEVYLNKKWGLY